jgi:hypothetical protein
MPGLINSKEYAASRLALCSEGGPPGADEAIDAIEWMLLEAALDAEFPQARHGSSARYTSIEATQHTPAIVVVFDVEFHDGVDKWILLDVFVAEEDEDD